MRLTKNKAKFARVIILSLFLFLVACKEQILVSGVNQSQSLEILVVLKRVGITAERELEGSNRNPQYKIVVDQRDYSGAIKVLHEYGLPKDIAEDLDSFTRPKGFVPNTPEMSRLRLDRARALQIEHALRALPGVIDVRAIVRTSSNTTTSKTKPGASVIIKYEAFRGAAKFDIEKAKKITFNALPELAKGEIIVTANQISTENIGSYKKLLKIPPFDFRVYQDDFEDAQNDLLMLLGLYCLLGGLIGIYLGWKFAPKKSSAEPQSDLFIESESSSQQRLEGKKNLLTGDKDV